MLYLISPKGGLHGGRQRDNFYILALYFLTFLWCTVKELNDY